MKKNFKTRIISLILAMSLLFSCMTVLSYATDGIGIVSQAEGDTETIGGILSNADEGVTVQLNRTFDDGFDLFEGITSTNTKNQTFELADDGTGNKYLKMTANDTEGGYFNYYFDQSGTAGETLVVKFDIIFDSSDGKYPGRLLRFTDSDDQKYLTVIGDNGFYSFKDGVKASTYYNNTKHTVAYVVTTTGSQRTISAYVDGNLIDSLLPYTAADAFVTSLRLGFFGNQDVGTVVGIDNLAIYSCDVAVESPENVDIGYGIGSASDKIPFKVDLFMKVGVDTALSHGEKVDINPPINIDGETYVPIGAVADYLGYTADTSYNTVTLTKSGADTITLAVGEGAMVNILTYNDVEYAVVNYEDIENIFAGYYASYNDMGVIVVSTIENFTGMATDLQLVDVMKRFIFDSIDENKEQVNVVDKDTFTSATATSKHPYILADAEDFTNYRNVYAEGLTGSNPVLYSYIDTLVKEAEYAYETFSVESAGVCTGVKNPPAMPDDNIVNNGYDPDGGRQHGADTYAERMKTLAFGYQITRDENYARLAYHYAVALGDWEHWGPAHFLNCADAAAPYAIAYDWLYNVWTELDFDVAKITEIIFTHGVLAGWYAVNDVECPWARRDNYLKTETSDGSHFYTKESNWNAVCSSGMTAAALAIAGDSTTIDTDLTVRKATLIENDNRDENYPSSKYSHIYSYEDVRFQTLGDHTDLSTYADYAYDLFTTLQYTLPLYGLDFYAPDGSYVESPSYWAYSAKNLFTMGAYSESIFADDFGLITNCWGLDKTCYYALNAQSSDYSMWNYSDSTAVLIPDPIPTVIFPFAAYMLGKSDLAQIRRDMIDSGKYSADYLDIFYYYKNETTGEIKLPELQYHMASIDGYVARDSWEPGSTYVAIKGGYNLSAHGQVDSGEFVYHNNGKIWFCDTGTEHYTVPHFGHDVLGLQYYRMNAEGNNTLALGSDPLPDYEELDPSLCEYCYAGQYIYGTGHMYKTGDNEYGAYSLINQTEVYNQKAVSAKRGMLFTNSRTTVVIQDEVTFREAETVYWIGHTYQDIYVTTDGRSAYMTDGESVIRVTLISSNADLRFDILTAYEFVLEDTHSPDYALNEGTGVPELDRSAYRRLVIECKDVTQLDLAVVIEDVTGNSEMEVGYEYTPMDEWVPTADGRASTAVDEVIDFDDNYYGYTTSGELEVIHSYFVNSNMLTVWAINDPWDYYSVGDFEVGARAMINFPNGTFTTASLSGDCLVFDLDIYTDSNANGLGLSLYGNGSEIASQPLSTLVSDLTGGWAHITIIATDSAVYFFKDGTLKSTVNLASVSYKNIAIAVTVTSDAGGTVSLDNIRARRTSDTELAALIADGNIASWSGYIEAARERVEVFTIQDPEKDYIDEKFYTFSSVYNYENNGYRVHLLQNNTHAPIYLNYRWYIYYINNDSTFDYSVYCNSWSYKHYAAGYVRFQNDPVDVNWHIDANTVETNTYTGMKYATYTGTNSEVGKITMEVQADNTIKFYTTAWSLTEDGEPATAEDMIVRSDSSLTPCNFYLTKVETDVSDYPYFYVDSSGNLVARESVDTFAADVVAGHQKIILTSDLELSFNADGIKINSNKNNLYLNGHTLKFNGGSYAFRIYTGGYLHIYGGGGSIIRDASSGNVFYVYQYNYSYGYEYALYVDNTTVEYGGTFTDFRQGPVYFKNVTFNQTKAGAEKTLVVQNRYNSLDNNKSVLTLDGCTVNHYNASENSYAISVESNAELVIKGNTHINIPNGIAIKLQQASSSVPDYAQMSVSIEDAYINAATLYTYTVDGMEYKLTLGDNVYLTTGDVSEINVEDGLKVARRNDTAYPYVVTNTYATVTWVAGDTMTVTEYWLAGSLPAADNEDVKNALAALNESVESGKKYSYSAGVVKNGDNVTFTATEFNKFTIAVSLTLEASMKVNVFVEKCDDILAGEFYLDGTKLEEYSTVTIGGKDYYKIVTPKITIPDMTTGYEFMVKVYDCNNNEAAVRVHFSIIDYVEKILENGATYGREAIGLMANILKYAAEAYKYAGLEDTEGYTRINTLLAKYQNKVTYSKVEKSEASSLSAITDALCAAEVILSEAPRYRFSLNSGYTGQVTLGYTVLGVQHSKTFDVVNGQYEGNAYIELELSAYDMRCDITITTAGGTGVYNLKAYYNAAAEIDSTSTALLNALYAYSEKAEMYKKSTQ